jgi:hypothetical protein
MADGANISGNCRGSGCARRQQATECIHRAGIAHDHGSPEFAAAGHANAGGAAGLIQQNPAHRHFRDKDELLAAVAAQGFERLARAMIAAAGQLPPVDTSALALTAWSMVHGMAKLAVGRLLPAESKEAVIELTAFATRALSEGLRNLRPSDGLPSLSRPG